MRAVIDTNIFVYATYKSFSQHGEAIDFLKSCQNQSQNFLISWGIIYEYLRVVTHDKLFPKGALSFKQALENVQKFCDYENVTIMTETAEHFRILNRLQTSLKRLKGNIIHDSHIVALMMEHDIKKIYTNDVDFRIFPEIKVINPVKV